TPQQAWQQIAEYGDRADAEIFVAPNTLVSGTPQDDLELAAVSDESASKAMERQEFEDASRDVEAGIAHARDAVVSKAGSNGSAHSKHSSEATPQEESHWLGRARESLREWLAVRALLREIRGMEQQRVVQERQRQMALQYERERREQAARELAMARAAEQQRLAEQQALQLRLQREEEQRQEQEMLARRAVAEEELRRQAEQEEAYNRSLFVEEILREREQAQAAPALSQAAPTDPEAAPLELQPVPAESFAAAPESTRVVKWSVGRYNRLKPAMALAGITSTLLMAALVGYAHRRPASPVPLAVVQRSARVEQKVPFGPAVLPAPASAAMQLPADSSPEMGPTPERHSFRRDFRRVRVDSHEVDYISDGVTVRHFIHSRGRSKHPASAVPISASSSRIKEISDME
ncbi:MAG TPA: hypothetical protein VKT29_09970, partial [Terriglobales bacterium]|nr:hypothetical protein [Terriglobales bacterium]